MTDVTGSNRPTTATGSDTRRTTTPGADRASGATTETTRPEAEAILEAKPPNSGGANTGTVADAMRADRSDHEPSRRQEFARQASERSEQMYRGARRYGRQVQETAEDHFLMSITLAAGVGILIGYLIGRNTARPSDDWDDDYPYDTGQVDVVYRDEMEVYPYRTGATDPTGSDPAGLYPYRAL